MPGRCRRTVYRLADRGTLHLSPACPVGGAGGSVSGPVQFATLADVPPAQRIWCGRCGPR
jgi:hypothetical protein